MGTFYTNITVYGPSQQQVLDYLNQINRTAYVSPTIGKFTVIYDEETEDQDLPMLAGLASGLSRTFACPALAVLVHDSDLLVYQLYRKGQFVDEYNSLPGYFEPAEEGLLPEGGNAVTLTGAFDVPDAVAEVEAILRTPTTENGYLFAEERHARLASVLGMPALVDIGYEAIESGAADDYMGEGWLQEVTFIKTAR